MSNSADFAMDTVADEGAVRLLRQMRQRHANRTPAPAPTATPKTQAPDPAKLRSTLAAAIVAHRGALEQQRLAEAAVERGQSALTAALEKLSGFDDMGARRAQQRAQRIAAGIAADDADPAAEREAQEAARCDADELRGAVAELGRTAHTRRAEAERAGERLHSTALTVMVADGAGLAARVQAFRDEARALRVELAGMAQVRGTKLSREMLEAIYTKPEAELKPAPTGPVAEARNRWSAYRDRLLQDADAQMEADHG